jgi:hypothetical protein
MSYFIRTVEDLINKHELTFYCDYNLFIKAVSNWQYLYFEIVLSEFQIDEVCLYLNNIMIRSNLFYPLDSIFTLCILSSNQISWWSITFWFESVYLCINKWHRYCFSFFISVCLTISPILLFRKTFLIPGILGIPKYLLNREFHFLYQIS